MVMGHLKDVGVIKASVSDAAARFSETQKFFLRIFESTRAILT